MRRAVLISIIVLLVACDNGRYVDGDMFYLVNKQAKMPVVVRGNTSSRKFILFLHGGPGGTSIQKIGLPAFNELERTYSMVYWDQRASGSSQGNSSNDLLTLEQFTEDLDKLVTLVKSKYGNPDIFLMGHSWGGCLGTAYLTDVQRQSKIKGWIEVDGAHNNPMGDDASRDWVLNVARTQIKANVDVDLWNYALDWYRDNPNFTSNQMEHYSFVEKAHGYVFQAGLTRDPKTFPEYSFMYLFNSPADVLAALTNYEHVIKTFIISDIDLTPKMKDITLPTLIVWGRQDGIIPFEMAQQAFDAIGSVDKSVVALDASAHFGYYEQPDEFVEAVRSFIEGL